MTAEEIIQKLILGEIALSQGLLLTKVHFGNILESETIQWINHEIDHYEDVLSMPEYRIVDCDIIARVSIPFQGVREEIMDLHIINDTLDEKGKAYASPNKMLVRQGIESIEISLRSMGHHVVMDLNREQVKLLMRYCTISSGCRLEKMYQQTHSANIKNIIPVVRNKLISVLQTEVLSSSRLTLSQSESNKTVFISYGWDNDTHRDWVRALADRLSDSFNVVIDAKAPLGTELNMFMEQMISHADRVLLILTPMYKLKADNRQNGVGYESVLISSELYHNQSSTKFIPVIRKGSVEESYPLYLGNRKGVFMTVDDEYESALESIIEDIKTTNTEWAEKAEWALALAGGHSARGAAGSYDVCHLTDGIHHLRLAVSGLLHMTKLIVFVNYHSM